MNERNVPDPNELADRGSIAEDDPMAATDDGETYLPPSDPVEKPDARGDARIVGGFSADSMSDETAVPRSITGGSADEALADRIRRELVEDASTTDLDVEVDVREGTAYLRGRVSDLVDADNAMAVAGRVPGVIEVVDELTIEE
jgi:hypothetical protein